MAVLRSPVAHKVIGAAIRVHRSLGPGCFESVYESCLDREFREVELPFERQVEIPVSYRGDEVSPAFRADFVVGGILLVELKSVERIHPVHEAQVLTYLRLSGLKQGLLINFNVPILRHGLKSFLLSGPTKK